MKFLYIFIYFVLILWLYVFIYKRLKFINKRHIKYVWCTFLETRNNFMLVLSFLLLVVLFILGTILIITLL